MNKLEKMFRFLLLGCCLVIGGHSSNAHAQTVGDTEMKNPNQEQARNLLEEGNEANAAKEFDRALELYKQSFELYPSFDVAGNMGIIEVKFRYYPRAAEHLEYSLRNFPSGESRKLKAMIEKHMKEARQYVGGLKITVSEDDARVLVDGERIEDSPVAREVFVMPGEHTIRAESANSVAEQSFTVEKGETLEIDLALQPKLPASGLDGPASQPVESPRDTSVERNWAPAWILGGVTVAALGTSFVFRGLADSKKSSLEELGAGIPDDGCSRSSSTACSDIEDVESAFNTQRTISNTSLIVAGVGAAATIGYVVYNLTKSEKPSEIGLSSWFDGSTGFATVSGRF